MNQQKAPPTNGQSPGDGPSAAAALLAAAVRHHQAGSIDEAERGYRKVLDFDPNHADSLHYLGVIAHQRGKNDLAIDLIGKAIVANGRDTQSHYHLALVLGVLGRFEDAIEHYRKAIELYPNHVSAHLNIAVALLAKRQWDEAAAHCRRVLEITPNHPGALNSLGLALQGAGEIEQAADSFQAALQSKPDMLEALNNRAKLLLDSGNAGEALAMLVRALGVSENGESQRLLAACLTSGKPLPATDAVRQLVLRALQEGWTGPDELAGIAESFIKIGPAKEYLRRANEAWPARLPAMDLFGIAGLGAISGDGLLRTLLETVRNSDIEIERLLTASRAAILMLTAGVGGELEKPEVLGFCCALARQCFINEYVWSFSDGEIERARRLRDALATAAKDGKPFSPAAVAIVAAYFPLHSLDGADLLLQRSWPAAVSELLTQQVREPQAERELRASTPRLTPIEDEVSRAVQQQYEEHPFPRWVKLARPGRARTLNRTLRDMFPLSGFVDLDKEDGVEFLIAGCGTGQQSIERAQAFAGVKFTAIDLSMASLCYARRKTGELKIANVDYAQADIVKLGSIGRSFDAIETSGVLVAIGDPWGAWRTLLSLLKPGGVMSIGLYSEVARRDIVAAQKYLAAQGYRATEEDMRRGRQDIMALDGGSPVKKVTNAGDFFSMSNCRDMLFHVQEHRFALPQIKDFLAENGLIFLGFALDEGSLTRYAARFPDDPARTNLDHWHQFEQENPDTFISMYQFWVQKPRAVPTSSKSQADRKKMADLKKKSAARDSDARVISIRGAREHNLKNVDLDIPRDRLVVITGLSGSGKSSLAFDTIYAEGQRRYVESLSAYARQFLEMMQKPDVDRIDGLSPAISIEQKTTSRNPRSTVGTVTEIYDYMRLLWARIGIPYSPATGLPIESQTVSQMVDRVLALKEGTRFYLLAPVVRGRKGEYRKDLAEFLKRGFQRVKIDGKFYEISEAPSLDKKLKHDLDVVVDRLVVRADIKQRLAESFETALKLADGIAVVELADVPPGAPKDESKKKAPSPKEDEGMKFGDQHDANRLIFSSKFACPVSGFTISEIEPRLFSFNSPHGACPACSGLGVEKKIDADLVIPDQTKTLRQGAIAPWSRSSSPYYTQTLDALARIYKFKTDVPWKDLPKRAKEVILYGTGEDDVRFVYDDGMRSFETKKPFEGVMNNLERRWRETESNLAREDMERYFSTIPCSTCNGYRLKPEALAVRVHDKHIGQATELSVRAARRWFEELPKHLSKQHNEIASRVFKEIRERLTFLVDVGLDYLTMARASGSLSGGESQRIRLASQIGSGLTGVLYVLDEPSIGLHQRDNARLLETLKRLRDLGNTVIVVEHDEEAIRTADHLVDVGPGAGIHGGKIIAEGTLEDIFKAKDSLTGDYLTGRKEIATPERRPANPRKQLRVLNARGNNLKNVDAEIPIGLFTCITGVSGGGKSTLLIDTLYNAVARRLNSASEPPAPHDAIQGLEFLDKVIDIDQSPIGRTPRSNPATYTGAFTPIREWYTGLPEAKARGYEPGRFSFNVKGGRCEACQGDGVIKIEMHFLPDVYVTCDVCKGKRYNRETLEVTFKGKSIADVLDMTVEEGIELFRAVPAIRKTLETLAQVGLDYIHIGQQATTLSGGEAQRVKLAKELAKRATGRTLYILDEPTTGLHFHDVAKLLEVLHELVDNGNTVVVIEHNLEVIKTADWIIDLGPEGGDAGGEIVAAGTPEKIAATKKSYTGQFLAPVLARGSKGRKKGQVAAE